MEPTHRPTVPAMESLIGQTFQVLDLGSITLLDYMGSDEAIEQAARTSYQLGTRHTSTTRQLIRYLMRHRHSTPFEMCEIKVLVKAPIFVVRQWFRHRTASINEASARYSIVDREFYVPPADAVCSQSTVNKQGSGQPIDLNAAEAVIFSMNAQNLDAFTVYESMVNDKGDGVPKWEGQPQVARELARVVLPLATYTTFVWKIDLHNLLHFLSLRADPHAQAQIREYADVLARMVEAWCPHTWEAFTDYRLKARTLSRMDLDVLRSVLARLPDAAQVLDEEIKAATLAKAISVREACELVALLGG